MKHISRAIEHWKGCDLAGLHGTGVWVGVKQRETCQVLGGPRWAEGGRAGGWAGADRRGPAAGAGGARGQVTAGSTGEKPSG